MSRNIWATNGGVYLGFPAESTEGKPPQLTTELRYKEDRHLCLIGPNRTGKTKRLLLPALFDLTGWSIVVNDIRGDLCKMTEAHRRAAGNTIIKLNPFDVLKLGSDGFDPIQSLELNDEFPDDALQLAEAVIRVEGKQPHFSQAAQAWVAALIMYVRLAIPNGSFADVRALLGLGVKDIRTLVLSPGMVIDGEESFFTFKRGKTALKLPGIMKVANETGWEEMGVKAARFGDITPENREILDVISTALNQTNWLDSRPIKRDLAKNPFDFAVMKDRPVTVYLILPARRFGTHSSWLRLIITSIVQKLMRDAQVAKVPTLFAFDEYAVLAGSSGFGADDHGDGFPVIARNMAMLAGYSIKLWTIWQDLAQAEKIYGMGFESFLGNAGIAQFFAPQDIKTAEYISKRSGQTTRQFLSDNTSMQPNPGMPGGISVSVGQHQNFIPFPLMLPQDARNMDTGFSIVFTHLAKGPVRTYVPWPAELKRLRAICALDPANA
jgi:type IV secretion system protein VirD4